MVQAFRILSCERQGGLHGSMWQILRCLSGRLSHSCRAPGLSCFTAGRDAALSNHSRLISMQSQTFSAGRTRHRHSKTSVMPLAPPSIKHPSMRWFASMQYSGIIKYCRQKLPLALLWQLHWRSRRKLPQRKRTADAAGQNNRQSH